MNDLRSVEDFLAASNGGIVGISPTAPDEIYGGYDQPTWMRNNEWYRARPAVRIALADYMIALWTQRRAEWLKEEEILG